MPYCNIETHKNDPDWNYRVDACPYCQIDELREERINLMKRLLAAETAIEIMDERRKQTVIGASKLAQEARRHAALECYQIAKSDKQTHAITITTAQQDAHNRCCDFIASAIKERFGLDDGADRQSTVEGVLKAAKDLVKLPCFQIS